MKVSIAMAVRNGARFLSAQLESFRLQQRTPDELVVCDDGSTDDTLEILEQFKRAARFEVNIVRNSEVLGFTRNFEKAVARCSGDLIFFADQDDIWFPQKVDVVEKAFEVNPQAFLLIHDGELVDDRMDSKGATKFGQVQAGYGPDAICATGALSIVRRELLDYALPIPEGIQGHDGWLHKISSVLGRRMVINETLQYLRRHSSNTSSWVASSLEPIDSFAVALSQVSTRPALNYQDRLVFNHALTERLDLIGDMPDTVASGGLLEKEYECLVAERRAIINREKLAQSSFLRRKALALQMLASGDYVHFNGLKSFARDLFR